MEKQSRKVLVLLKCLVSLVLMTGISTTSVATIYNVNRAVGPGTITGTIETNGATGVLTPADIIDWNLTVDADGDPTTFGQLLGPLSGNNSSFAVSGSVLTATPTALFFDFSSPAFDILQIASGSEVIWQLQASAPIFSDELIREALSPVLIQAFVAHPPIQQQIATAAAAPATLISDLSPYSDGGDPADPVAVSACNGSPQFGRVYRNSETEPYLAVNPTNPDNLIAGWHQDRWSSGGAQGTLAAYSLDGGASWTPVNIPFSRCAGAAPGSTGDFARASDPWISFGPDGAAYYMALVFNTSNAENGMAVAKSVDGGVTWSEPVIIKQTHAKGARARAAFHDKNSLTADPFDPNLVYATWTIFRNNTTTIVVARSTDGGLTWGPARPIGHFEVVGPPASARFRQGVQIVVLPDGTLVNAFFRVVSDPRGGGSFAGIEQAIFRSTDQGKHWERLDTTVAEFVPSGGFDVELGIPVRDAGPLPDIAVDRNTGTLFVVWQDGRLSPVGASNILIALSTDRGDTWLGPFPVTDSPFNQAFLPSVAVTENGTIGVMFYDFRNDVFGDPVLSTDVWLITLDPAGNFIEERLTDTSFDMRQMVIAGGYFPGDYVGLETAGNDFVAAFTVANNLGLPVVIPDNSTLTVDNNNRQDIVFKRVSR